MKYTGKVQMLVIAALVMISAASLASAFSFSDLFFLFGVGAMDDAPMHHTVYLVSPMNNSYTSQNNDTLQFVYNHTGSLAGVVNCTLLLDDFAVNYTESVAANTNIAVLSNQTIAEGAHNWWVNCTNGTDTESSIDIGYNFTFIADYTNPSEPTLISPANNTNSTDNTPDLDWTTVTEQNFKNYTVQADDNSAFSSPNYIYNTTAITESNYSVTSAWADGKWYWRVIAYDNAGNSNTSGYFAYTADTSAPAITLDYPRNGSVMRNGTWINLTITDLTGVNASWWSNNSGTANYTLTSPWDINTAGWSEGDKAIDVWANDSFGFLRRNTYMFRIDDTPPYIAFVDPTPPNGNTTMNNWTYINTTISDASNTTAFIDWNRSLVGWWRFNREAGENDTFVRDWSSYGNNGIIYNTNPGIDNCTGNCSGWTTSGKFGNALVFDGVNDYVGFLSYFPQISNNSIYSITGWFSVTNVTPSQFIFVNTINNNDRLTIGIVSGSIAGAHWNGVAYSRKSIPILANTNYFFAYTYNNGTSTLIVNNLVGSGSLSLTGGTTGGSSIGRRTDSAFLYFNGTIDEIRIWNRALSSEEINASYNAGVYQLYHNFTNLTDGVYTYTAYAQDLAGNINSTETRTLYYGNIPLVVTILSPSNNLYDTNWIWANVSLNIPGSWCGVSLNGTTNQTMSNTSTTAWYINLSVPSEGSNSVEFWCNDTTGNLGSANHTWKWWNGRFGIWDTMVKENSSWAYQFITSQSWVNKANWIRVPYGNTTWNFTGDTVIENDYFWLFLHSNQGDSPFIYANFNGTPSEMEAELYGVAYPSSLTPTTVWNYAKRDNSTVIKKNNESEIIIQYDSGSNNTNASQSLMGYNIVNYTITKSSYFKIAPVQGTYAYYQSIHSAPNRFAVAPGDSGTGNDYVIDPVLLAYPGMPQLINKPPLDKDNMLLQQVRPTSDNFMWMVTYPPPIATNTTRINVGYTLGNPRLEQLALYPLYNGSYPNITYIGVINHKNVFHSDDINTPITAGDWYNSSWHPTIPGRWRMSGRVNDTINNTYYTTDVYDGNFTFTSPVNGTLEVLVMYLYDRTSDTPANVSTPMDIYRDIFGISADTDPPSITILSPLNQTYSTNSIWFNITLDEAGSWAGYSLDGAANVSLTNSSGNWNNLSTVAEGFHNVTFYANDTAGNMNASAPTIYFTINGLNSCNNLSRAGTYYTLTSNVSSPGTCFNILANNITLDGAGFTVNYSQASSGTGVSASSRNNVTIKNLKIMQGSTISSTVGIGFSGSTNSVITNNTIRALSDSTGIGIWSNSNSNIISNNDVITNGYALYSTFSYSNQILFSNITSNAGYRSGVYLEYASVSNASGNIFRSTAGNANAVSLAHSSFSATDNLIVQTTSWGDSMRTYDSSGNITGGSIYGGSEYNLAQSTSQNFKNTNFTGPRYIYFDDTTSWFNYNNETNGNIWLKTSISVADQTLTRTLVTWSNSTMKWNDTNSTVGITAYYNITGLAALRQYDIYNSSGGSQEKQYRLTTDSGGRIYFNISLKGNIGIWVELVPIDEPPAISALNSPANNSNFTTGTLWLNATGYDDFNLTRMELNVWNSTSLVNQTNITNPANDTIVGVQVTLTNGTYRWNYRAYDNVSQTGWYASNYTFAIDGVPPTSNSPANASYTQNASATIGWILYDNYAGGYYTVYRNGTMQNQSTWSNNTNLNIWVNTSTLGTWNYTIVYNDSLGNNGVPNTVIINVTGDLSAPKYSLNSTNSTTAGASIIHSLYWADDLGLSGYIFSFDNCTGSFVNETSWVPMTGTGNWSNATKTINSTAGCTVRWRVYANDTSNNWNESAEYVYSTTDNPPTYSGMGTNKTVANQSTAFYAYWTDDISLSAYIFSTNNSGVWVNETYSFTGTGNWSNSTLTLNETSGLSIGYRFYSNDTSGQWNDTGIMAFTTLNPLDDGETSQFWVRTDGNDTCSGQQNLSYAQDAVNCAWQTVQNAASTLTAGQTARIQSGTYNENNILFSNTGSSGSPITLAGDGIPKINGTDNIFNITKNYIRLTELNITSLTTKLVGTRNDEVRPAVKLASNYTTLNNNIISTPLFGGDNYQTGGYTPALYVYYSNYNNISNNTMYSPNIRSYCIHLHGSTENIIINNALDSRNFYEIGFGDDLYQQPGIQSYWNHTILNNTAYQGNPIYYYYNKSNEIYDYSGTNVGMIYAAFSNNLSFSNINILNNNGMVLFIVKNSTIENFRLNQTVGNGFGPAGYITIPKFGNNPAIDLWASEYNTFNNITVESGGRGNDGFRFNANDKFNNITNYYYHTKWISGCCDSHNTGISLRWYDTDNIFKNITLIDGVYSSYILTLTANSDRNKFINISLYRYGSGVDGGPQVRAQNTYFEDLTSIYELIAGDGGFGITGGNNRIFNSYIDNSGSQFPGTIGTGGPDYGGSTLHLVNLYIPVQEYGLQQPGVIYRYWYLDVNVTYANGTPVNNAVVNITNEVNASITSTDYTLVSKSTFNTDESGHTKIPDTENASDTILLVAHKVKDNATAWENYTYTISASDGTYTASVANVTPNPTWYRPDPSIPTYTVNIVLSSESNGSQTLDNNPNQFWVRTDGNDSCNGQNNMPYGSGDNQNLTDCAWLTVTNAGTDLTAGQTVRVQAGNYSNQTFTPVNSGNSTHRITYQADGDVILGYKNYTGYGISGSSDFITIDGFSIYETYTGIYAGENANNWIIQNNDIHKTGSYTTNDGNGIYSRWSDNNIIRNNNITSTNLYGIYIYHNNNVTVENNTVGDLNENPVELPYRAQDYAYKYDFTSNSRSANNVGYSTTHNWRIRNNNYNNMFINETSYDATNFHLEIDNSYSYNSNWNNTFRNWIIDGAKAGYGTDWLSYGGLKIAANSDNNTFENFNITNIYRASTTPHGTAVYVGATYSWKGTYGYNQNSDGSYNNWESSGNVFYNFNISNSEYGVYFESPNNTAKNVSFTNNSYDYYMDIAINETITDSTDPTYRISVNPANASNSVIVNYNDNRDFKWKYDDNGTWNMVTGSVTITSPTGDMSFSTEDVASLTISLNSPLSSYLTSNPTQTFNCSSTSSNQLANITLFGNWSGGWSAKNSTNITGTSNSSQWQNTLSDGTYIWNCLAYDNTGNSSFASSNYTLTIDMVKPVVQIILPTNTTYNSITRTLNYTASDMNLNTAWYYYNGTNTTLSGNVTFTALNNQQSTLTLYANDTAGNVNSTSVTFTIDTLNPQISFTGTDANNSYKSRTWIWANVTINETNFRNVTFYLYNTTLVNSTNYTDATRSVNWTGLAEGVYYINATVYDNAGNYNYTETRKITLDTTTPILSIISPSNTTYATSPQLNFTYTETNPSACKYSLNGASNQTLASCFTNSTTMTSTYGSNNVILYMNDTAGNLNSTQRYWTYDNIGPQYSNNLTSPSSPQTYTTVLTVQFNITATDQYSGIDTVLLEFNGTNYTTTNVTSTYTKTLSSLAAGSYNYRWHINDTLGNINTTSTMQYTITKAATTLTLLLNGTDTDNSYYTPASVNATYTKDNSEVTVSMYRNGTALALSGATNISNYSSAGSYNYTVNTSGSQNYSAASASHIVTILATPAPNITNWQNNITNSQSLAVTMNETQSIYFNITIDQPVNYSWSLDSVDQSINFANYTYSNTQPGTHSIKVNISNINGTNSKTWTLTVKDIPNINTVQESIDPVSVGSIITIEANITDLDSDLSGKFIIIDSTWYAMQPNGVDKYLANYTPAIEKIYSYYIYANDTTGLSTNTTTYTFTSQQGPAIRDTIVTPSSGNESTNFIIQANITDLNSISTAYAKFTQPTVFQIQLSNTTDIYNTTYNSTTPGTYIFDIWSNDTLGTSSSSSNRNFTIADTTPPNISTVTITPSLKNETTIITITANATDYNLTSVHATITGPANSTRILSSIGNSQYSNTTGNIPHKPGFYSVEITATDASNNNATFLTNYTINDTQAPALNSLSVVPTLGNLGTSFNISANVTDNNVVNSTIANITKPDSVNDILILSGSNPYIGIFSNTSWLGLYTVYITANDSTGNTLYSFSYPLGTANFSIADTQLPSINQLNVTPASINTTGTITISANVTDDNAVNYVIANITRPDSYVIPITGFTNTSSIYTANFTNTTIPGLYTVTLTAVDIAGNTSTSSRNFTAVDTMTPQITLFSIDDITPSVNQKITFTATSSDNDIISKVTGQINITKPDNTTQLITMTETGTVNQGSPPASVVIQSESNYTPTIRGNYTAILTIRDTANNTVQSAITFEAFDTTGPSLSSISISAIESENITINITTDEPANYTFVYDAGTGWNYRSNSSLRLNHTITLPQYNANTTIHYYINLTDQYANAGRYPSVGVNNFTVDGTLQFNQTTLTLNLTEKQSRTIQIELRNPSSIPINATLNKTKSWTTLQSSQYLNPLQTATINITLTPDDISIGDWQTTETITAHGSALATFIITLNIAHAIGDGECDSGESCGTADCPACSSSSSSSGSSSSGGGGGGGLLPVKRECTTNTNCTSTQVCKNYKCIDIKCATCEYIQSRQCTKYECCKDTDCTAGYTCKSNICQKSEEPKSNITIDTLKEEAEKAISTAKSTIIANKPARDTKEAERVLRQAESAFAKDNYGQAKELAQQAKLLAENAPLLPEKESKKEGTNWLLILAIIILLLISIAAYMKKETIQKTIAKYTSKDTYKVGELEEYLDRIRPLISMYKAQGRLDDKIEARLLEIEAEKDKAKQMLKDNSPEAENQIKKTTNMLIELKADIEKGAKE